MEQILHGALVFGLSMLKFILGIGTGAKLGFSPWITALVSAAGMVTIITTFSYWLGEPFRRFVLKRFYKNRKLFTTSNRRKVRIWRRFGLPGVAFLTPVLFSPIGGALIANSFGADKRSIVFQMLLSALFWGFVLSYSAELLQLLIRVNPLPS
ncbi:MAG: hypothetical protein MUF42_16305 [Cytophagaceae bacterium]|jgi:hypothetical protein|nr:hypothetical protein [Cytophagaceae bacterium]